MPRGGKREGTPGKGYSNRSDLNVQRAPQEGLTTAAAGGQTAPASPPQPAPTGLTPDQTPFPTDPTTRPGEPVTAGLSGLPSGPAERDDAFLLVQALMLHSPNPDLARLLARMETR